jgi:hypothetical protein
VGATLALRAFSAAAAHGLDGNPRAMLVRMALSALDDAERPRYWAGWEPLAEAIGHALPSEDDDGPEATRARRYAQEAVRLSVRVLRSAGLISASRRAAPGRNAEYSLCLPVDNSVTPLAESGAMEQERPGLSPANAPDPARQTPRTRPGAEEDRGETEEETRVSAHRPDSRCSRHLTVTEPPPCRACGDARRAAEAYDAAEAHAERARRAAERRTLDPAAVQAVADRFGGRYSPDAIRAAAEREMPENLALGLRMLAGRDDLADELARWER